MRTTDDVTFGEGRNASWRDGRDDAGTAVYLRGDGEYAHLAGRSGHLQAHFLLHHDHQRRRLVWSFKEAADDRGRGVVGKVGDDLVCGRRSHEGVDIDCPSVAFYDLDVIAIGEFLAERAG